MNMNPKLDLHLNPSEYIYDIDELIEILLDIKKKGEGTLNYPKALLTLAVYLQNNRRLIGLLDAIADGRVESLAEVMKNLDSKLQPNSACFVYKPENYSGPIALDAKLDSSAVSSTLPE